MKLAQYVREHRVVAGLVVDDELHELEQSLAEVISGTSPSRTGMVTSLAGARLLAPVPLEGRGLFCAGINYVEHQMESASNFSANVPSDPIMFFKTTSAVADPFEELQLDASVSKEFDWEVELGVVIGRSGRHVSAANPEAMIFGYTIVNDVTARDLQRRHVQWLLGKNVDRSTPVGPWIVTADEFGYPPAGELRLSVNGIEKQRGDLSEMIFDIGEQIAAVSRTCELLPGDLISTGTPSGVGFARTPPEFLQDGDLVSCEIAGIGTLVNTVAVVSSDHEDELDGLALADARQAMVEGDSWA